MCWATHIDNSVVIDIESLATLENKTAVCIDTYALMLFYAIKLLRLFKNATYANFAEAPSLRGPDSIFKTEP